MIEHDGNALADMLDDAPVAEPAPCSPVFEDLERVGVVVVVDLNHPKPLTEAGTRAGWT